MDFLEKLRSQPRPVRTAVTWGTALLLLGIIVPLWLSSLAPPPTPDYVVREERSSEGGALDLFFGAAKEDVSKQLREAANIFQGMLGGAEGEESDTVNDTAGVQREEPAVESERSTQEADDMEQPGHLKENPRSLRLLPRSN